MPFFIATMSHPDGDGWNWHLAAHVAYLNHLVAVGSLRASGPLIGTPLRSGFLIFTVPIAPRSRRWWRRIRSRSRG